MDTFFDTAQGIGFFTPEGLAAAQQAAAENAVPGELPPITPGRELFLRVLGIPSGISAAEPIRLDTHYCVLDPVTLLVEVTTWGSDFSMTVYSDQIPLFALGWPQEDFV